jgi:hypothetical protein
MRRANDTCKETGEGLRSDLIVQMQVKQTHVKKSPVFSHAQLLVNCLPVNAEDHYTGVALEITRCCFLRLQEVQDLRLDCEGLRMTCHEEKI